MPQGKLKIEAELDSLNLYRLDIEKYFDSGNANAKGWEIKARLYEDWIGHMDNLVYMAKNPDLNAALREIVRKVKAKEVTDLGRYSWR